MRNLPWAIELARKAVELNPRGAHIWNTLGVAYYRAGKQQEAIDALEKSLELQGANNYDFLLLAMAHWQQGNKDEARRWYDQAVARMAKNPQHDDQLHRFRAEAEHLLGIAEESKPVLFDLYGGIARYSKYSSLEPGTLVTLDPDTGAVAPLGLPTPRRGATIGLSGLAFNSRGELFASISSRNLDRQAAAGEEVPPTLIQIDPTTGALSKTIGILRTHEGGPVKMSDLAMQPGTDVLFGISSVGVSTSGHALGSTSTARLYTIDTTTALATLVGDTGLSFGGGLAFAPDGTLYQTSFLGPLAPFAQRQPALITLNPTTAGPVGSVLLNDAAAVPQHRYVLPGLAVRPSDGTLFASGSNPDHENRGSKHVHNLLVTIDPASGFVTPAGPAGGGIGEKMGDLAFRPEKGEVDSGK